MRNILVILYLISTPLTADCFYPPECYWPPGTVGAGATQPPQSRWGFLSNPSFLEDNSEFRFGRPGCEIFDCIPAIFDVETHDGEMYTAGGLLYTRWDISNPAAPSKTSEHSALDDWLQIFVSDSDHYIFDLAAITDPLVGGHTVAMTAGSNGFVVWRPGTGITYQDSFGNAQSVYVTEVLSNAYAAVAHSVHNGGVFLYDLTLAAFHTGCLENSQDVSLCGGVTSKFAGIAQAHEVAGTSNWVAVRAFGELSVWDISNPLGPAQRTAGTVEEGPTGHLAMWEAEGNIYLAMHGGNSGAHTTRVWIYNVSCIATDSCSSLPAPMASYSTSSGVGWNVGIDYFEYNGRRYLYAAHAARQCEAEHEWILDVTDPSSPTSVMSQASVATSYWSWNYEHCIEDPTVPDDGLDWYQPISISVENGYLYRAGNSLLDQHVLSDAEIFSDGFESGNTSAWSSTN